MLYEYQKINVFMESFPFIQINYFIMSGEFNIDQNQTTGLSCLFYSAFWIYIVYNPYPERFKNLLSEISQTRQFAHSFFITIGKLLGIGPILSIVGYKTIASILLVILIIIELLLLLNVYEIQKRIQEEEQYKRMQQLKADTSKLKIIKKEFNQLIDSPAVQGFFSKVEDVFKNKQKHI